MPEILGHHMVRVFLLAFAVVAGASAFATEAAASGCRSDSPMVTCESFGVATPRVRAQRYDAPAYTGESGFGRANSSDPMVWSDARWRSSLFGGYARHYDNRFDFRSRPAFVYQRVIHAVAEIVVANLPAVRDMPSVKPRQSKVMRLTSTGTDVMANRVGFAGNRCSGVLVLTWKAAGPRARCFSESGRVRTPL